MISSQLLDAGQALTVQGFQRSHLRTQALVRPNEPISIPGTTTNQGYEVSPMASLEKLHTQKKTAESAVVALVEIKNSLEKTQGQLVINQSTNKPLSELSYIQDQAYAIQQVKLDLEGLRDQVANDANEKTIFQALEKVVDETVEFYDAIEEGMGYTQAMDEIKKINLSVLSSQAQIERVQGTLEASTFQVVQLASSYEANLFNSASPFEVAQDLYGLSFQSNTSGHRIGAVLDQVS